LISIKYPVENKMNPDSKVAIFQEKQIRRLWDKNGWWFSIVDVVEVLTENQRPSKYWNDLKRKMLKEGAAEFSENIGKLKMEGLDGKMYPTDCANTEGMFRIIMSISSPKAEPFKLWLARVGQERVEEIENPEIAIERVRDIYKAKGYSDEWIESRIKSIGIRKELTDEWKKRNVQEGQEYSILTAEIAKATFGMTPSEHKKLKKLETQNLRDHMTNLELIFTMLGEEVTRTIAIQDDAIGFNENMAAAQQGGEIAGDARLNAESKGRFKVISSDNFLNQIKESEKKNILPDAGITGITEITEG
jgi:DNA-damage-inducible protein D